MKIDLSRRDFLLRSAATSLSLGLFPQLVGAQEEEKEAIAAAVIERAEQLAGLDFTEPEIELMRKSVSEHLANLQAIRDMKLPNSVPPALTFRPLSEVAEEISPRADRKPNMRQISRRWIGRTDGKGTGRRPQAIEDLAFAPLAHLTTLLHRRRVKSVELTRMYLERLKRLNDELEFVITFTEDRALEQAAEADAALDKGYYRGPLHGVPWGAKDLLAVEGYPTTWGAAPYQHQRFDTDATVVQRLDAAGAVLVAKTSVGALAWGDVWFGGTTKNPWNLEQGSSGSSAGSASAVAAGALPFALGTETLGSIVSPCSRCGATGIRPTFGRVPRTGCMALSWSMDKIGAIARSVEDAAAVLEAIHGADGHDPDAVTAPLDWQDPRPVKMKQKKLRFGYAKSDFEGKYDESTIDQAALEVIRGLGFELEEVELPDSPVGDMLVVLEVEAAAAFDELTRENRDDEMVRQVEQAWPNVFRAAQLVTGVQYVQAQRARSLLARGFEEMLGDLDGYVAPSFAGRTLLITNLTGHPCVVLPNGFRENGTPTSLSFIGQNYGEGPIAALAASYQKASGWHRRHPSV